MKRLTNKMYQSNDMMNDWMKFVPQEMDRLSVTLFEIVQSFDQEVELAWFIRYVGDLPSLP